MLPKDTPYPFDSMPEENYYGEFRELASSIGPFVKKDKDKAKDNDRDNDQDDPDNKKSDDAFEEFSIFPKI